MFDRSDVSRLILNFIQNSVIDLLNVTLDLQMLFDFEHVFCISIFSSCKFLII